MEPIRSLVEIPFRRLHPLDLLHLREDRDAPDPDFAGFGYGRVDRIWLEDGSGACEPVEDALVLALHSSDLGQAHPDDVELEFFVDEVGPDYSVKARLSAFLAARLAGVRGDERAIVLALCNPHRAVLGRPAAAGTLPLHYPMGDVESWLDPDGPRLRLTAGAWRTADTR